MWYVLNELHIIKLLIFIFIHCSASFTLLWVPKGADDSAQFLFAKDV